MFTWLKNLFGKTSETLVLTQEVRVEEKPKSTKKVKPKKAKTKTVDLNSMNKTQLLAEAKKRGIKANASLKKEEVLERIKNG